MKLIKISVKNYKCLKDVTVDFEDFTVLIGKNDAGKSTLFKALDIFFNSTESIDFNEISVHGSGSSNLDWQTTKRDNRIFYNQIPSIIEIVGYFELDEKEIIEIFPDENFTIQNQKYLRNNLGNIAVISSEIYSINNSNDIKSEIKSIKFGEIYLLLKSGKDRSLANRGGGVYDYNGMSTELSGILLEKLKNNFVLIPATRSLKKEKRNSIPLSPEGSGVPSYYLKLEKDTSINGEDTFDKISQKVNNKFPKYYKATTKENGEENVEVYFGKFPSSSVGDGIKQFFLHIYNLYSNGNKIFGIEEPEIHLHPGRQKEIFKLLKEKSKENQIIITTHSPIFVSEGDVKTYLLSMDESTNETKVKLIEERNEFQEIKLELGGKNTDLFFYDCVILIEGETEDRILPIISEAMGYDLLASGIKLINIRGSGKATRINEFLMFLKDSGISIFVIADGHKDVKDKIKDWIREGILKEDNFICWEEEIEDTFTVEQIIEATKMVFKENDSDFYIDGEELKKKKKESGKPISKILMQMLYEKGFQLNKPLLGEKLGILITKEIESGGKREETEVEKVIQKLVKLID